MNILDTRKNVSVSANEKWFSTDISINFYEKIRMEFATTLAVLVQYTLDGGSTWIQLVTLTIANKQESHEVTVATNDLFNMRTTTIGGTTINWVRIIKLE